MTLTTVIAVTGGFALVLTTIEKQMGTARNKLVKNYILSLLQNFVGGFFIFSGMVKAVDPLGTAYKMNDYFAEFEGTFGGLDNIFSSLSPMFATMAEYTVAISVFMIVFEIVLGVSLIIGALPKWTAWAFFLLVAFFTVLTGYTYLTGYVPQDVNFFEFSKWGVYEPTNMKVTDCGCFGDFLVLEPIVTFRKDVVLLIPALIFLLASSKFHQLFTKGRRLLILGITTAALLVYCFSNYVWDIPSVDFRPFTVGTNIAERKALEEEAASNVKVIAYKMTNKASGEEVELPFDEYLKEYTKYPKEEWDLQQIKTEPAVKRTKITDFEASALDGTSITHSILSDKNPSLMIVAYKLYGTESTDVRIEPDTVFVQDTIIVDVDTTLVQRVLRVDQKEVSFTKYSWDETYLQKWKDSILPLVEKATAEGMIAYCFTAYSDPNRVLAFKEAVGTTIPFCIGDDLLLKTIVRSNPGPVLLKNGEILEKWHYKNVPSFEEIKAEYINE